MVTTDCLFVFDIREVVDKVGRIRGVVVSNELLRTVVTNGLVDVGRLGVVLRIVDVVSMVGVTGGLWVVLPAGSLCVVVGVCM